MATVATPEARARLERMERIWAERPGVLGWLTTTDHKRIGILYFFTTLVFFGAGGIEALLIRTQLIHPNGHVLSPAAFDEVMTMHGVTMIFFFVIPMSTGAFGNYLLPLMIGARDMAFPRLNALSYWLFLGSGVFVYAGLVMGKGPTAGWFDYVPLASRAYSPGQGIDFYCLGLIFNGISSSATSVNFITTMFRMRAPGMSLNRMPLFCFAFLAVSFALLFALPVLNVDLIFLELDRRLGFSFFNIGHGGDTLLWQHLFWIFGHPEVYIIILPAFGIATSIIPTFTRRRMIAFPLVALAEILVAFIGFGVWAHHMFATGLSTATVVYFAAASLIIVIPSGIQLFAWCATIATGRAKFDTPLLFIVGFIIFFLLGGLSGVMLAAVPFDQQVTDTYFIVAHFHFVIFGAAVFPILGGMYYWFPKVTGRLYHEGLGKISFLLTFIGTAVTFFPMHIVGLLGMPRRQYTYHPGLGWDGLNLTETIGAYVLATGLVLVVANLVYSFFRGPFGGDNPFAGATLEWATTSPPPHYNYAIIPKVTSPYPVWDREDRKEDAQRVAAGEMALAEGHETPSSTTLDAEFDEILDMPSDSPWPPVLGLATFGIFVFLLNGTMFAVWVFVALAALALLGWALEGAAGGMSGPLHSTEATSEVAVREVERNRKGYPIGMFGAALLVATEITIFATLFATYFYLRSNTVDWPPRGVEDPKVALPLILNGILALTSVPMFIAAHDVRVARLARARWLILLALVVQGGFFGIQLHEIASDLDKFSPQASAYGSIYFTMLGVHQAHVAIGILLDVWLLGKLVTGLTQYRATATRAIALYWHFVNLMAICTVLTQVSPSL